MTDEHRPVRKRWVKTRIAASRGTSHTERVDRLATEEPMEIRAQGPGQEPSSVAVTMRTPGDDFELATGFLVTEGLIRRPDEIETVAYCLSGEGRQEYNVVTVRLRRRWDPELSPRTFSVSSSCGICGKATLDEVEVHCEPVGAGPTVGRSVLLGLPNRLRDAQTVFHQTGGLHAAASFTVDGDLDVVREDVGRHNAFDKLVGEGFLAGRLPLADRLVMVSGRASFEIVQKAAVAGIPVVCAVSAPSSLAVDAAERFGVTLVGFLRDSGFNVYTHRERIDLD